MPEPDTKSVILDAAEVAFANQGFEATSLRQIIGAAKVNLAAIHYHFGSKDALIEAVFTRRLAPVNTRRLAWLDAVELKAGPGPLPLEEVVRALLQPMLDLERQAGRSGTNIMRIFGRLIVEPNTAIQAMLHQQFGHVVERFSSALTRALPELPRQVLLWRFHFSVGSLAHVMCDPVRLKEFTGGLCDPADSEELVSQLVAYVVAGLRAPVP